jgi:hypothetical protein
MRKWEKKEVGRWNAERKKVRSWEVEKVRAAFGRENDGNHAIDYYKKTENL